MGLVRPGEAARADRLRPGVPRRCARRPGWSRCPLAPWEWLREPPDLAEPPAIRSGFRSYAECRAIVDAHLGWRDAVRSDLQMHTSETDGALPLAAMVDAAAALGRAVIAITDHSKGLAITNGMDEARLARQGEEIAVEPTKHDAAGVRSIEMNLSPQGIEDMEWPALRELDLRLGAFHSKLRSTEDQTGRYLAALENRTIHVLAHPRGRIWNFRLGLTADWARVAERSAELDNCLPADELIAWARGSAGR